MTSSRGPWSGWRAIYRSGADGLADVTALLGVSVVSYGVPVPGQPAPGQASSKSQPGPRPPLPAWRLAM